MSDIPFFSVVIPVYNREKELSRAIKSVLNQDFESWEIVVANDGSTQDIPGIVASYKDERISCVSQENKGGGAARNLGIDHSIGQYIAFLDSDDLFQPSKLRKVYHLASQHADDLYFSYTEVDRGNGKSAYKPRRGPKVGERIDEYLFSARQAIQTSTVVIKREIAKRVRFDDDLRKGQDLDFAVRLFNYGVNFTFISEVLSIWTDQKSEGRVSHRNNYEQLENWLSQNKHKLSLKAYYGYRANVLSFELSRVKPMSAIKDIVLGSLRGGVTVTRSVHSLLRAFVPSRFYRKLIDYIISIKK